MIACLLEALDATHSTGIIHRDIKPENLVFDDKGYLHLTDYGIARHWEPENYQENSGTPGYMAPEMFIRGGKYKGIEVDLFALGVVLFILVTGFPPF